MQCVWLWYAYHSSTIKVVVSFNGHTRITLSHRRRIHLSKKALLSFIPPNNAQPILVVRQSIYLTNKSLVSEWLACFLDQTMRLSFRTRYDARSSKRFIFKSSKKLYYLYKGIEGGGKKGIFFLLFHVRNSIPKQPFTNDVYVGLYELSMWLYENVMNIHSLRYFSFEDPFPTIILCQLSLVLVF